MKRIHALIVWVVVSFGLIAAPGSSRAGDWPMWRYDAQRSGSSPHALPATLHLQWVRQLPAAAPAWPKSQQKLQFDLAPQPVVVGTRIFVPSSSTDSVTAYDTRTGRALWRFFAEGPVRFAPLARDGRVLFTSDDGLLYCVDAATGALDWKLKGCATTRRGIGNGRLISSWPARGGPVSHGRHVYFAASIWPFMGIFVHCIDVQFGAYRWTNSGDGTNYTVQPHGAPSFASVVPQGHLAIVGDNLVVPGGRSTPAVYDLENGRLRHFEYDKRHGGHAVSAHGGCYWVNGQGYVASDGKSVAGLRHPVVMDDKTVVTADGSDLSIYSGDLRITEKTVRDRRGKQQKIKTIDAPLKRKVRLNDRPSDPVYIKAGSTLYVGGDNAVAAYDLNGDAAKSSPTWSAKMDGRVWTMLAADNRLFVVTLDGRLHCFGADKTEPTTHALSKVAIESKDDRFKTLAADLIEQAENQHAPRDAFVLVFGVGSGRLIDELVLQSELHLIVVEPDADKVDRLRRRMMDSGVYGQRVAAIVDDERDVVLPPYFASLVTSEDSAVAQRIADDESTVRRMFDVLRPYGGRACFVLDDKQRAALARSVTRAKCENAVIESEDGLTVLVRKGALPDTDDWTHQYANAAQTVVSKDKQVKTPLGLLWFGGPSHEGILPRHGHGPSPQVAGGRLFIEGPDMLRAVDVYTGRVLWEKTLKDFGKYYDTTAHFAGAGEIGSNYVSLPDRIYAVYGTEILELESATGDLKQRFTLEAKPGQPAPYWGHVSVSGDYLIATSSPVKITSQKASSPRQVVVMPRDTVPVIKPNAKWRYLAGADPKDDWASPAFDDGSWKVGAAGFGYGDGDDRTQLNMRNRFTRVYARCAFDGKAVAGSSELGLVINYDDAFIAYLNGKEVLRVGVGAGRGGKASRITSHEANGHAYIVIKDGAALVRPGRNVLAIEGHNVSAASSDFTLDPYLVARRPNGKAAPTAKPDKAEPKPAPSRLTRTGPTAGLPMARYASGSRRLAVFNRQTGQLLWTRDARYNFRHNNIAIGPDKVFCIDSLTDAQLNALRRRGIDTTREPVLYALNLADGRVAWRETEAVFGTFLSYSADHDLVLQAGSAYRDRAKDETDRGMAAFRGRDGEVLWHNKDVSYGGPCLLWRDQVLTNGGGGFALDVKTGKPTGWSYKRMYGCNTAIGSEHLITFRSGAAGFYDLTGDGGTGNIGGFRSSCTNNLIVANGVLSAPDYTRTCNCAYQNQTSLALIHMPEADVWTYGARFRDGRVGVNFGAPGDRRAADGTLWVEHPVVGGSSDKVAVTTQPATPEVFRFHSSEVFDARTPWIASSGFKGVRSVSIGCEQGKTYRVTLHFLEPEPLDPGQRRFDVSIQGKRVLQGLDVAKEAEGSMVGVTKTFTVTAKDKSLLIELAPIGDLPAVISGVGLEAVSP